MEISVNKSISSLRTLQVFFFLKRTNEAHSSEGMGEYEKLDLAHIFIWDIKKMQVWKHPV